MLAKDKSNRTTKVLKVQSTIYFPHKQQLIPALHKLRQKTARDLAKFAATLKTDK